MIRQKNRVFMLIFLSLSLLILLTANLFADRTINSVNLNGSSAPIYVPPGSTVSATLYVTTSGSGANHNLESIGYQIESASALCDDSPSSSNTVTNQPFTISFTAPNTLGVYDINFTAHRNNGCNPFNDSTPYPFTLTNKLTVCNANSFSGIIDPLEFEGDTITTNNTINSTQFKQVTFNNKFSSPPAVFVLPSNQGSDPANVRIRNVTRTGFEIVLAEPSPEDGGHKSMDVAYFAINKGVHKIGNTYVEVGVLSSNKVKPITGINHNETYGWNTLSPLVSFCNPAVVANIQTMRNEPSYVPNKPSKPFLVPAIITNGSDINITLDKVPTSNNNEVQSNEEIAYMIAEGNIQDQFIDTNGKTIKFETIKTGAIFPGWSDSPNSASVTFANSYTNVPMVSATKVSNNEEEPGWFRSISISKTMLSMTVDESENWPSTAEQRLHAKESGAIFAFSDAFYIFTGVCQYVKSRYQTTIDGYYYVDEGIADIYGFKPFEIYCENMNSDGVVAYLPTLINQTNSDNSNFKFNTTHNNNYYSTSNSKTYFNRIKISNQFTSETTSFANGDFSNINLSGTSFRMDINNASLSGCDSASNRSLLRVGTQEQVIKIDPKVQTQPYCHMDGINFNQISNYYAKDEYINNGFSSCQEIGEYQAGLPSGYYLLNKPLQIAGQSKYYVTYCEMSPPAPFKALSQLLIFDGKTTQSKTDLTSQSDTCSQLGLSFFTPNTEATMDTTREFLSNTKSGWEDYTGTVLEYFNDHGISGWATDLQTSDLKPNPIPNGAMWPYGPLGIYKSSDGASNSNKKMAKSTKWLTNSEKSLGFGSLDETGWTSVLPEIDPTYPADEWFVANLAAGYKPSPDLSARSPQVIEPNGDYDANNWLGWFADTNGYMVHFNDQNGASRYRYTNFMCMTRNNYHVNPPIVVNNAFDAWDSFRTLSDRNISTKIVNKSFDLNISSLDSTNNVLQDFNGTVCTKIVDSAGNAITGWNKSLFNTAQSATTTFTINRAIGGTDSAGVKLYWKKNVDSVCPIIGEDNSSIASDRFSVRPASFTVTAPNAIAGVDFNITFTAPNFSGTASADYNESSGSSFEVNVAEHNPLCAMGTFNPIPNSFSFLNGTKIFTTRYSEVGVLDINITDLTKACGAKYANIDCDDADVAGYYSAASDLPIGLTQAQITIKPHHFDVTGTLSNFSGGTFTYLSNDLNMSAQLDLNITAKNGEGNTTANYSSACYAKNTDLTLIHSSIPDPLTKILYTETLSALNSNVLKADPWILSLNSTLFSSGSVTPNVDLNFDRSPAKPLNPFDFNITSATATDSDAVTGTGAPLGDTTFVFGRARAYDVTTNEASAPNPIEFEVYSTTSSGFVSGMPQNVLKWYRNLDHDIATDGNVISGGFNAGTTDGDIDTSDTPTDGLQIIEITSINDQTIHLDISPWLWYSPKYSYDYNGDCTRHPCFNYDYTDASVGIQGVNSGTFQGSDFQMTPAKNITNKGVKLFR